MIGHLSKAISPNATRIGTMGFKASGLYYTAVENTDGTYGLVLQNDTQTAIKVTIDDNKHSFAYNIPAKSLVSCRWKK